MNAQIEQKARIIIDEKEERDLLPISEEIVRGIEKGVLEGIADGLKKGAKEGLKDCLMQGLTNIEDDDIVAMFQDIAESVKYEVLMKTTKEGADAIFDRLAEVYVGEICTKIKDELNSKNIVLTKEETGFFIDHAMKGEKKVLNNAMGKLPKTCFYLPIIKGIRSAFEENMKKHLNKCGDSISSGTGKNEEGGEKNDGNR